jgi:hypothetical protein
MNVKVMTNLSLYLIKNNAKNKYESEVKAPRVLTSPLDGDELAASLSEISPASNEEKTGFGPELVWTL